MAVYRVGEKVLGFWGAIHPLSYGKIEKIAEGWCDVVWSDGTKSIERVGKIYHDMYGACGCGVYFCAAHELNQYPDEWFEVKVEEDAI